MLKNVENFCSRKIPFIIKSAHKELTELNNPGWKAITAHFFHSQPVPSDDNPGELTKQYCFSKSRKIQFLMLWNAWHKAY